MTPDASGSSPQTGEPPVRIPVSVQRTAPDRPLARRQLRGAALVLAGIAASAALAALAGWLLNVSILTRLHPDSAPMRVSTALMLLLLAAAVALDRAQRKAQFAARACAAVVGTLAVLGVAEDAGWTGRSVGSWLDSGHGSPHPDKPSVAIGLTVLLLALTFVPWPVGRRDVTQTLALIVTSTSGLAVLGFAYRVQTFYDLRPYSDIAVQTAAALALMAMARLLTVHGGVAEWVQAGVNPGALLMRIVVPAAAFGLPLAGYAVVLARRQGWVSGDAVVALMVLPSVLALIGAAWATGVKLDRVDRRRRQALADLHALAEDLELQVVRRAEQVQKGREELILLADRQRIAADLHDIVVQRLFAAGMTLNSVDPDSMPTGVGERVDDAVEAMDAAIRDLRASIFELSRPVVTAPDLVAALDDICVEASRVLGFEPDLTVDDPDSDGETMRADVLAVTREALANVARHAEASAVIVTLRSGDGFVTLTITDDGTGMTPAPHSSGTRNIQERAERRGGTCRWSPVDPHGTTVVWQVPAGMSGEPVHPEPAAPEITGTDSVLHVASVTLATAPGPIVVSTPAADSPTATVDR